MKFLIATIFAVITSLALFTSTPAVAADLAAGGQVFASTCAACHIGGGNAVNPTKTLKKADLEQNGKDSVAAIVTQVTNGNGAMPAFGGRLTEDQIANVAAYILDQSSKGW